ncbi:transglutaminase family protein [Methanobacterium sp.]|uniref:transglutaminase-like domain-containing protein n=1 Tax=Methanobacterium sp. TaxID=2164 RepID=UPI002ABA6CB1|nr:transglutaminase family protein [Methanobacterium sp.]MDY9923882.1 transglutaminase family protein [Methanobacterium sp.]
MLSLIQKDDLNAYLKPSEVVDYNNPEIQLKAWELAQGLEQIEMAKSIYHFVRDEIHHSLDIESDIVTCRASDVLKEGQGICFAKSNLLAAFLRFMDIPTGFCYQTLTHEDGFVLHGLNAVYLDGGWFRLDARGNRADVDAQFSMGKASLAFYPLEEGEKDYPYIFSQPDKGILSILMLSKSLEEVMKILPSVLNW